MEIDASKGKDGNEVGRTLRLTQLGQVTRRKIMASDVNFICTETSIILYRLVHWYKGKGSIEKTEMVKKKHG